MGEDKQKKIGIGEKYTNDGIVVRRVQKREIWESFGSDQQAWIKAWGKLGIKAIQNIDKGIYWKS